MTRLIVTMGFVVAFLAGLIVGLSRGDAPSAPIAAEPTTRPAAPERGGRQDPGSVLAQQLSLSDEQQRQMREIWSAAAGKGGREAAERRRRLREERDAAIAALVRPEDKPAYEAVLKDHDDRMAAMEAEWRQAFQSAVEKTKAILTPEQRTKYEQMIKRWDERDRRRDNDRRRDDDRGGASPDGGGPGNVATTAPAGD